MNNNESYHWMKSWVVMVLIILLVVVGGELVLRSAGYFPNVIDNKTLWANTRRSASREDGKVFALLGDSRMLYNIDPMTIKQNFPDYDVAQLAICAQGPVAVLKDLANDPQFKGIVICAISCDRIRSGHWNDQQKHIDFYHQGGSQVDGFNQSVEIFFQEKFVMMRSEKRFFGIGKTIIRSQPFGKPHTHTFGNRSSGVDLLSYNEKDLLSMVEMRKNRAEKAIPITPEAWLKEAMITEPMVQRIHARGGRVIFVRMPTSNEYLEIEYRQYPKSEYWDKFEAATSAETIHFEDVAEMKAFHLPDRSHIDILDRSQFTQVLTTEMTRSAHDAAAKNIRTARANKYRQNSKIQ